MPDNIRPAKTGIIAALMIILTWTVCPGAAQLEQDVMPPGGRWLEGVIIRVVSAEEMVLWQKGKLYPFTLYGLDLPEPGTPDGDKAKKIVSDMIFNTLLRVYLVPGEDSPPAGIVMIHNHCMNETLVRSGTAGVAEACTAEKICKRWKGMEIQKH